MHSPRLRYVLLFGDVDKIVMSQDDEDDQKYTDHYFFTHKDAGSSECILPFVSGGRIPATSEAEGMRVVTQIIRYETEETRDTACQNRIALAGYFEDCIGDRGVRSEDGRSEVNSVETMEDISTHMTGRGYEVSRTFLRQPPPGDCLGFRFSGHKSLRARPSERALKNQPGREDHLKGRIHFLQPG